MSAKDTTEEFEENIDGNIVNEATEVDTETTANDEVDKTEEDVSVAEEDQLREDLAKERDKFLRLFAEFENFKRRTSKERIELFKTAGQEILTSLLPVLDDFDRALKEMAKADDKEMFKGVELIRVKFREILKSKGLEEVEVAAGDTFDAEVHDAITQIPAPDKKMKGKIVDVVERGFKLGERIIRHPKVVVGK